LKDLLDVIPSILTQTMLQPLKCQRVYILTKLFQRKFEREILFSILFGPGMQWFVGLWNSAKTEEEIIMGDVDTRTYRYEIATALLFGSQPSLEAAEIAIKVLDWADEEPLIAYLYILYLEKVCELSDDFEGCQNLLFEVYKRALSLRQAPSSCNLG
jgi:hypothetical protein